MKLSITVLFFFFAFALSAQIPAGYYNPANGLMGGALQNALHNIIKNHNVQLYSNLYNVYDSSDLKSNTQVWDMYSDVPSGTPPYVYYNVTGDRCGSYTQEGDCFNREHSWPQSWFNYSTGAVYSDAFHIFPTDGWVNAQRSNYPFGEVNNPSWTSQNGSKLGPNATQGYTQTVFEPIDEYKGDIARGLLYVAVRYLGEDGTWVSSPATNQATILPWELCVLLNWHNQDPVSPKEINRNNAIYKWQNNRNPFIDRPGFADSAFTCTLVGITNLKNTLDLTIFPNPCGEWVKVNFSQQVANGNIFLINALGEILKTQTIGKTKETMIDVSGLAGGIYILNVSTPSFTARKKLVIEH